MSWYQFLCLIGVPSLCSAAVLLITRSFIEKTKAIMLGVQALLRAQMISEYNCCHEKGFAPISARDNFENCWKQYHNLGANGVMDGVHEQFMTLPVSKED